MTLAHQATRLAIAIVCAGALAGCGESRAPAMATAPSAVDSPVDPPADRVSDDTLEVADAPSPSETEAPPPAADSSEAPAAAAPSRAGPPVRTADISFDDLKFEMLKTEPFARSMITDKINALDGRSVRIRGYILPSFQQTGLTQFVLVRDNLSCCFGPGAALYDCIVVDMQPGKSTDFSISPVTVEGTFSVRELLDPDGKALAIYHLDGESVR
ncbi:MAG TPA: DUF3299 domain-containing protein [Pirellulales bacterium]|nr:DUF3299 domain-containing protein [Pirellulales bacterium]